MTWTKRKELYNKSLGILFTTESKKTEPIWRVNGRDHYAHLSRKNRELIWVRIALKEELVHKFVNSNSAIGRKG